MYADLHTHTYHSDGKLTPQQLIEDAHAAGVTHLAITDHDNDSALQEICQGGEIPAQPFGVAIKLIAGIEFSTCWESYDIHVLALNYRIHTSGLVVLIERQLSAREDRNLKIKHRLLKAGVADAALPREDLALRQLGRVHFADMLVEHGYGKNRQQVFKRYLGNAGKAYVKCDWANMEQVLETINLADGRAVLAHPLKYRMTRSKLERLVSTFKALGGAGIEVCSGRQTNTDTAYLVELCRRQSLMASVGSDFHQPQQPWAAIGCAGYLPTACEPIWSGWSGC